MSDLSAAEATIGQHMNAIGCCFVPGVRVTVLARNPHGEAYPGARDFLMTSDNLDDVAEMLRRRIIADSYVAKRVATAVAPTREQGLAVEIIDGRLFISIGVDALMVAVKGGPVWSDQEDEERGWVISDPDGFAAEIAHELQNEEDDGTTLVHVMLDAAIERAIEKGSLSIDFGEDN